MRCTTTNVKDPSWPASMSRIALLAKLVAASLVPTAAALSSLIYSWQEWCHRRQEARLKALTTKQRRCAALCSSSDAEPIALVHFQHLRKHHHQQQQQQCVSTALLKACTEGRTPLVGGHPYAT